MNKKLLDKSNVLYLVTLVLSAASCIVYAFADARQNSALIICLLAVSALLELILCIKKIAWLEYVPFICVLVSAAVFIRLAFDEVGDVLSKINMNGLSTSWIASAVLIVITMAAAALSTVFVKEEQEALADERNAEAAAGKN